MLCACWKRGSASSWKEKKGCCCSFPAKLWVNNTNEAAWGALGRARRKEVCSRGLFMAWKHDFPFLEMEIPSWAWEDGRQGIYSGITQPAKLLRPCISTDMYLNVLSNCPIDQELGLNKLFHFQPVASSGRWEQGHVHLFRGVSGWTAKATWVVLFQKVSGDL